MKNGKIYFTVLIILILILIYFFTVSKTETEISSENSNNLQEGTYSSGDSIPLKCTLEMQSDKSSQLESFYDAENNIIGACRKITGPTSAGCGPNAQCTSTSLTETVEVGECKGMTYQKYHCVV